jgi:hypothetical protein
MAADTTTSTAQFLVQLVLPNQFHAECDVADHIYGCLRVKTTIE